MPMQAALSTLNADTDKGRKATDLFRHAYNNAALSDERGQVLNENKAFPAALRKLIEEHSMPVSAPEGGRIHTVRVLVNPAREWKEAVQAVGPDTGKGWDIWKVGDKYPTQGGEPQEREIILVNFGKTIPDGQHALDWAKLFGLQPATPRAVFAVAEHNPKLHNELKVDGMAIVALEPCVFEGELHVCYAWLHDSERDAYLRWFDYDWYDYDWFAFVCE